MNNKDINAALAELSRLQWALDDAFAENGGEITEELEGMLDQVENVRVLLESEGIDSLGRWLKGVEDRKKALKAEKDAIDRQMKGCDKTIDFIKHQVRLVLDMTGRDSAKGTCYSFVASNSRTVDTDKELLKELYLEKAVNAIHEAGIPQYVGVSLTASVSAVPQDEELPEIFKPVEDNTVTFRKPRETKKNAVQPE